MKKKRMPPKGTTLESLLDELGERDEVYGAAIKRVLAAELEAARVAKAVSKSQMAIKLRTSRTQINRVLDPQHVTVSLDTLDKVARFLGKRLRVELLDA